MPEIKQGYFLQIYFHRHEQWAEVYIWLHDNVGKGNYQIKQLVGSPTEYIAFFKNEEDAMAFKLRWM